MAELPQRLWDTTTVCRYLGINRKTLYKLIRSGQLPAFYVVNQWRFRPTQIELYLSRVSVGAARKPSTL